MTGTRLEVEMYLVTVQSTAAQNLRRSVERARYRPAELVLEPLAASYAVLTDDEKELGVALVEVGGGSTGVAIFHEGKIRHLASLKYAGTHVTSDLVAGLGVTQADAERLKERHGIAYQPLVDASEMINLPSTPSQGARQASRELLSQDRKSTRLNSSHGYISYAVFCLKKKKTTKWWLRVSQPRARTLAMMTIAACS